MKAWLTALYLATSACTEPVELGTNVLWYGDHESGDLSEWSRDAKGGTFASGEDATCAATTEEAHSGKYSVKLTATATGEDASAGLYRQASATPDDYFSAWYFLPEAYETVGSWTILRLRSAPPEVSDPETLSIDVNLRSLSNGSLVLGVVEQRQTYLAWPIAVPTPSVPIGRWFQLEVRFRSRNDETGLLKLWLDGRLVYDIENRVTGQGETVYFVVTSRVSRMLPNNVELYVDDAMLSQSRITPAGAP